MVGFVRDSNPPRRGSITRQVPLTVRESSCSHDWLMLAAFASSLCYRRSRQTFVIISDLEANYSIQPKHLAKKKKNLIMSRIFEIPRGVWLVSIPLLVQMDTPIAIYNSATRGDNRNDPVSLRRFSSHDDRLRGTQHHSLRLPLDQLSDTPTFNNLVAPAFLVGKVDFLCHPFLYDTSVFELNRSLGSLDLDGREPGDNDEPAEHDTSRERHAHHRDDVNNHTDRLGDHDLPPSAYTRSHHRQGSDGGGSPPRGRRADGRSFNPYGPPKSTLEINTAIKDLLLRRHADADEGYVYGFQHPDDVAMDPLSTSGGDNGSPHLIKIGRSKDHQARMRQISKKCGYVPHTVFAHHMPQHAMVERLVHTQLHNSRLRDVGCTGCGARHEEWFQVGVDRAEHLVALWKAFAECLPYDAQGEMLPAWRERLEGLDLGDADCWEGFVHGAPLARPVVSSPQELQAETTPVRLVEGPSGPSSDRKECSEG